METTNNKKRTDNGRIVWALLFIIIGLFLLGRNMGIIDKSLFRILLSWRMLLIFVGIVMLFKKRIASGIAFVALGSFFMIPYVFGPQYAYIGAYWPLALVFGGVVILFSKDRIVCCGSRGSKGGKQFQTFDHVNEDGFVNSTAWASAVQHIVLDPVFRGANVSNRFAGTMIDLRKTSLEAPETYITVDCNFGGVELYVPNNWLVINELNAFVGGSEDKRYVDKSNLDFQHKLIIRGKISFGGVVIRN